MNLPIESVLAFVLFRYFPFGGLQRDFLRIAQACAARGHSVRVYTLAWEGARPAEFEIIEAPVRALLNHRRYARFAAWVQADLAARPVARVIGFNKLPGLDLYYAADPCFEEKAREQRHPLYRCGGRYRYFARLERAVFARGASTRILVLTDRQQVAFQRYYGTPAERFTRLPPPVSRERRRPTEAERIRSDFRSEHQLGDGDRVVLALGSGFATKGLDRSLRALAALPAPLRDTVRFHVVGADNPRPFQRLARRLGLLGRVTFFGGREDVQRFLLGADLLLHPAYSESGGIALLEAMICGLPVLATSACGFAPYIVEVDAGLVVPEPFVQEALDTALAHMLDDRVARARWAANGIAFGERPDLYVMAERAADLIEAAG